MTDADALAMIRSALAEVAPERGDDFASLASDMTIEALDLDSVTTMEMVGVLEEELDTTFPDEALPKVQTLGDIVALIQGA